MPPTDKKLKRISIILDILYIVKHFILKIYYSFYFRPNVCPYNVMSMVKVRKPCLRAYTQIEKVRKPNCPYSDEWCTDYKPK